MPSNRHIVVLAAGKGTRMKSARVKVLHRLHGVPLIDLVLRAAAPLSPRTMTVVTGHQAEAVQSTLGHQWPGVRFVLQEPQLGTAHALMQAERLLAGETGTVILLSGDVPLLKTRTLERLITEHEQARAVVSLVTAVVDDPLGYGRIVRTNGEVTRVVEERDASDDERAIREINGGLYAFELRHLFSLLHAIGDKNDQREYYLPEIVAVARRQGRRVHALQVEDPAEIRGINTQKELADVNAEFRRAKIEELMEAGVTIEDPASTFIGPYVEIGSDTVLHPNVILEGRTRIGNACELHAGVRIVDSILEDEVTISNFCLIVEAHLGRGSAVGPFAHLRAGTVLHERAKVGNFVELKKTTLGRDSKANHLAYLGDATIGAKVNIGAGTITCNYDGEQKNPTVIEDDVFIGSDTQLIAPVRVGRGAYVAAGSSIVEDVPPDSLAIARARQVNKEGWVGKKKAPGRK